MAKEPITTKRIGGWFGMATAILLASIIFCALFFLGLKVLWWLAAWSAR